MPGVYLQLEWPEGIANGTRHKMLRVHLHLNPMPSKCMQSNARNEHTAPLVLQDGLALVNLGTEVVQPRHQLNEDFKLGVQKLSKNK